MYWRVLCEKLWPIFRAKITIITHQPCRPCHTASPPFAPMESELPLTPVRRQDNFSRKTAPIHNYYRAIKDCS